MSHCSGTTTCRSANIWHMLHNMYLIIRVWHISIYAAENINLNSGIYNLYIYYKLVTTKSYLTSICMRLLTQYLQNNYGFTKNMWYKRHKLYQTYKTVDNPWSDNYNRRGELQS
jgi:hypothetical protein